MPVEPGVPDVPKGNTACGVSGHCRLKPNRDSVHGVGCPAWSTARTRHQNWSLLSVTGGEYRVLLTLVTELAMLLKLASSAIWTS